MDLSTFFHCFLNISQIWMCRPRCVEYQTTDIQRLGSGYLIAVQININACSNTGWTPLYLAAANGQHEIARMLLEHGAAIDIPIGGG